MSLKKVLSVLLCALFLIAAVVPALASSDSTDYIDYGLGVRVRCTAYLGSTYAKSTIKLSFVNGVNHFPESDYSVAAYAKVYYSSGSDYDQVTGNMSAVAIATVASGTATRSDHDCYIYSDNVFSRNLLP